MGIGVVVSRFDGFDARQWSSEAESKSELAEFWYTDYKLIKSKYTTIEGEVFSFKECVEDSISNEERAECSEIFEEFAKSHYYSEIQPPFCSQTFCPSGLSSSPKLVQ